MRFIGAFFALLFFLSAAWGQMTNFRPAAPQPFGGILRPGTPRSGLPVPAYGVPATPSAPSAPPSLFVVPRTPMMGTVYIPGGGGARGGMGQRVMVPMPSIGPATPAAPVTPTRAELSPQGRATQALREDINWVYGAEMGPGLMLRALSDPRTLELLNVAGRTEERVTPGQLIVLGILPQPQVRPEVRFFQPNARYVRQEMTLPQGAPGAGNYLGRALPPTGQCLAGAACGNLRERHFDTAGENRDVPRVQGLAVFCASGSCPHRVPGMGQQTEVRVHVHDSNNTTASVSLFSPTTQRQGLAIVAGSGGSIPSTSRFQIQGATAEVLRLSGNPPGTPQVLSGVRQMLSPRAAVTVPEGVLEITIPRLEPSH